MLRFIIITFISLSFLCSCNHKNECDKDIDKWIAESPKAYEEFLIVKQEILSNKIFLNGLTIKKQMFLRASDTTIYDQYSMQELKKWFKNSRGYISFREEDTSFCFKECEDGSHIAAGYVYYEKRHENYKSGLEIVDSLRLNENWFAYVVKYDGCNE